MYPGARVEIVTVHYEEMGHTYGQFSEPTEMEVPVVYTVTTIQALRDETVEVNLKLVG